MSDDHQQLMGLALIHLAFICVVVGSILDHDNIWELLVACFDMVLAVTMVCNTVQTFMSNLKPPLGKCF